MLIYFVGGFFIGLVLTRFQDMTSVFHSLRSPIHTERTVVPPPKLNYNVRDFATSLAETRARQQPNIDRLRALDAEVAHYNEHWREICAENYRKWEEDQKRPRGEGYDGAPGCDGLKGIPEALRDAKYFQHVSYFDSNVNATLYYLVNWEGTLQQGPHFWEHRNREYIESRESVAGMLAFTS